MTPEDALEKILEIGEEHYLLGNIGSNSHEEFLELVSIVRQALSGWMDMDDPEIEKIKIDGTKILMCVSYANSEDIDVIISNWFVPQVHSRNPAFNKPSWGILGADVWAGEVSPIKWQPLPPPPTERK